jgi:DNA-binding NarL/FixJ family response regulator
MLRAPQLEGRSISVLVGDSSRMGCQLMATMLKRSRYRFSLLGCAMDSVGVLAAANEKQPDVAIISAHLQDGPFLGFKVLREIRSARSKTNVIMLLDSCEQDLVVESFRGGARGVFSRDGSFEALCRCVQVVHQGQVWANTRELDYLMQALAEAVPLRVINAKGASLLTKREVGVVRLIAEGLTNRDISRQLNLSEHTVRNYLFRIFNKLGTSNRVELALYAIGQKQQIHTATPERIDSSNPPRPVPPSEF